MGRGRVEMKRIENKISRQVSFSKRRSGLSKKANEISVLCDAQVALIVFSTKGKLFQYSSNTHSSASMEGIIERYGKCTTYSQQKVGTSHQSKENLCYDYPKLVTRIELLQRNIRNYGGHDLDPLSLRELQSLEQQLDTALKRIRTLKNQLMHESISQLQKKERSLKDQNSYISKQLNEKKQQQQVGDTSTTQEKQKGLAQNISTSRHSDQLNKWWRPNSSNGSQRSAVAPPRPCESIKKFRSLFQPLL